HVTGVQTCALPILPSPRGGVLARPEEEVVPVTIGRGPASGVEGRVAVSHRIAAAAFRSAGVFGVVAVIWALVVLIRGGSWWGPLHSFLVGTVLFAIAGASQMFTITWAAAPPPPAAVSVAQRRI